MKTSKKILKKVSQETGINEDTVRFAIRHAWIQIEKAFKSGEYSRVLFLNLMTFRLSLLPIRSYIWKMIEKIRANPNDEYSKESLKLAWRLKQFFYAEEEKRNSK